MSAVAAPEGFAEYDDDVAVREPPDHIYRPAVGCLVPVQPSPCVSSYQPALSIFAQVSRSDTARLKTRASGDESFESRQK